MDRRSKLKRAAAVLLLFLLLLLFSSTLLVGIFGSEKQLPLLKALIFSDVTVPAAIYGWLLIARLRKRRK